MAGIPLSRKARPATVRTKLAAGATLLIGAIAVFIYLYFPYSLEHQAKRAIVNKAQSIAEITAYAVSPALFFEDQEAVGESFRAAIQNRDLLYLVVVDREGHPVAAVSNDEAYRLDFKGISNEGETSDDGMALRSGSPVVYQDEEIGHLYLGVSLEGLKAEVANSRRVVALVAVAVFLLGMVGIFGISTLVTGRLSQIARTFEEIARGDFTQRAHVASRDEVGALAFSFNKMADRLQLAWEKLRELNRTLESRVVERTRDLQQEIEEHQRTEEALRSSEQRFRAMFESTVVGIALVNPQGRLIGGNSALHQMLGYSRDELQNRTLWDLAHPEDSWQDCSGFRDLIEGRRSHYRSETRYYRKDGRLVWGQLSFSPIANGGGQPTLCIGMIQNITDRKKLEVELHRAQHKALQQERNEREQAEATVVKLAAIPRFNPNPVIEIAGDGSVRCLNDAATAIAEGLGSNGGAAILPDDTLAVARYCLQSGTQKLGLEVKAGERILDWSFYPAPSHNVVYGYGFDVTERISLEAQLREAMKMEAVGQLAGGVAHDFNNVLQTITGLSQLILSDLSEEDPLREDVGDIKKAAEHAASLTRQLLAFSRRQVLQPSILDLNAIVGNLQKMLRRLIGEDIELIVDLAKELGCVTADSGQIEQVIINLAVNARDAMPRGGQLTLQTRDTEVVESPMRPDAPPPGRYVVLTVRDTGCGMDESTRVRIFEPFFTTKSKGKGTGLGLATVYGIIRQSGGHVVVDSEPGSGTTFEVYLPRAAPEAEAKEKKARVDGLPGGSETILLVEDEDPVRGLVTRILKRNGYTVLEARHGGEALLVCERQAGPIHLMITDVIMPHMNGGELAERLAPLRPEMKVLFMSGYTDDAMVRHGVTVSGMPFLQKPFDPETLAFAVRQVLDGRKRRSPLSAD